MIVIAQKSLVHNLSFIDKHPVYTARSITFIMNILFIDILSTQMIAYVIL